MGGVLDGLDPHDPEVAADRDRLDFVRGRRTTSAQKYLARIAPRWDEVRSLHADDHEVESAILAVVGTDYRSLLDLGTGTGRMLEILGGSAERAIGLDHSHAMLAVARANLERAELRHVDLRQGDVYTPPFERISFDLVVIHQVLHFLDDPARALREAARLLNPGGRLLIVDSAPHSLEFLRSEHAHRRLGFRPDIVTVWLDESGLDVEVSQSIAPPATDDAAERMTVSLWVGRDRRIERHPPATADRPTPSSEVPR